MKLAGKTVWENQVPEGSSMQWREKVMEVQKKKTKAEDGTFLASWSVPCANPPPVFQFFVCWLDVRVLQGAHTRF